MRLLISEVLQKVSNAKTKAEKIALLQKHNSQTLRSILIWNFDESVESLIPEGEVPYSPNEAPSGTEHTLLEQESKRFYYFYNLDYMPKRILYFLILHQLIKQIDYRYLR